MRGHPAPPVALWQWGLHISTWLWWGWEVLAGAGADPGPACRAGLSWLSLASQNPKFRLVSPANWVQAVGLRSISHLFINELCWVLVFVYKVQSPCWISNSFTCGQQRVLWPCFFLPSPFARFGGLIVVSLCCSITQGSWPLFSSYSRMRLHVCVKHRLSLTL